VIRWLIICLLVFNVSVSMATQDMYPFASEVKQKRFHSLINQFRCLVCQNQSLADSNATLAKDLRAQIYKQVIAGADEKEVTLYLTKRYGDFVRYQPPLNNKTMILWAMPFILLIIGFMTLMLLIKRNRKKEVA